jgi:hypothetical protein
VRERVAVIHVAENRLLCVVNEPSCTVKGRKFLEEPSNYQLYRRIFTIGLVNYSGSKS